MTAPRKVPPANGKRHATQQSLNGAVKSICDIMSRREKAKREADPLRAQASKLEAEAVPLREQLKALKADRKTDTPEFATTAEKLAALDRDTRDLKAKAQSVEDAAYDLKAVNPHAKNEEDRRTPEELLALIEAKGQEVTEALAILRREV